MKHVNTKQTQLYNFLMPILANTENCSIFAEQLRAIVIQTMVW